MKYGNAEPEVDWRTHEMMSKIHKELLACKARIDEIMSDSDWDVSFFDCNIDLKVEFGESTVRVHEQWEAIKPNT